MNKLIRAYLMLRDSAVLLMEYCSQESYEKAVDMKVSGKWHLL